MAAVSADLNTRCITRARRCRSVVRLQYTARVVIEDSERAPLYRVALRVVNLSRHRCISEGSLDPSPTIDLKNAACGHRADSRKGPRAMRVDGIYPVEAALDIAVAEDTDQALADPIAF